MLIIKFFTLLYVESIQTDCTDHAVRKNRISLFFDKKCNECKLSISNVKPVVVFSCESLVK